ncbi:MAG TPA: hypothetical protein VGS22_04575 [Thermoanaerobaculia bacterium]|nr:hypothetical protein [Thermoanaerobaculia bacterium]
MPELISQLGLAFITTAVIDLLLFRGFEKWKRSLAAPFVNLAESTLKADAALGEVLSKTDTFIREMKEDLHRDQVELNLDLIRNDIEALRLAIDPSYREMLEAIEQIRSTNEEEPAADMTSPSPQASLDAVKQPE